MFRVKICGVKDTETAEFCSQIGVHAVGLNFYDKSKRFLNPKDAKAVADAVKSPTLKVGLFVNQDPLRIVDLAAELQLDAIQLHGNESAEILEPLNQLPAETKIIRAIRISADNEQIALNEIDAWCTCPRSNRVGAILIDPLVEQQFGGTGQTIDWDWLAGLDLPTDKPLILAGGLNPQNVEQAISIVKPFGVDVAGGVESQGNKDHALIEQFFKTASESFDRI